MKSSYRIQSRSLDLNRYKIIHSLKRSTDFYTLGYEQTKNSEILKPCQRIVIQENTLRFWVLFDGDPSIQNVECNERLVNVLPC
jgi:hypothetical protein